MQNFSPAAERNAPFIAAVLDPYLPPEARVLEIASGTGQHGVYFCQQRPDLSWQPSDASPEALASIKAWKEEAALRQLADPLHLDLLQGTPWPVSGLFDAIVAINMIHIAPWEATPALFRGVPSRLKPGGVLFLYGPYIVSGRETAPSNREFDASLRARDPRWGLRRLDQVEEAAAQVGLRVVQTVEMPANNLSLVLSLTDRL